MAAQSRWKSGFKTLHDKTFKQLDRVGVQVNKASGKLGMEGFWPGPMAGGTSAPLVVVPLHM